MKKALLSFLILLLILAVGVLVAPGFINWNSYKAEITEAAKRTIGREVSIAGDISVKLVPSPTVSVSGLKIANIAGGERQAFAQIRKADVRVAFLPLLGGKIRVESVFLDGPNILLEKLGDGRVNWIFAATDTVVGSKSAKGGKSAGASAFMPLDLSLERLEIRSGTVRFRDRNSGAAQTISDLQAVASLKSLTGPFRTKGTAEYRGLRTGFDLQIGRLRDGLPLPLSLVLKFPNIPGAGGGFSGRLQDMDSVPRLIGNLKIALAEPQVLADRFALGQLPVLARDPVKLEGSLEFAGESIELKQLVATVGAIRLEGDANIVLGDVPVITTALSLRKLNLDALLSKMKAAASKNKSKQKQKKSKKADEFWPDMPVGITAKLKLRVDGISLRKRLIRQGSLEARLENGKLNIVNLTALLPGGSDVSLSGSLKPKTKKPRVSGQIEFGSSNFRNFLQWLGVKVTAAPGRLNNFVLTAGFDGNGKLMRISRLKTRLDNSNINGGGSLRLQARPSFGLNLQIDRLNLDDYFVASMGPAKPAGGSKNKAKKSSKKKTGKPVKDKNGVAGMLASLRRFDANIRLKLGELSFDGRRYQGVKLDAGIFNGTAKIRQARIANFGGGPLNLSGEIQARGNGNLKLRASYRAASLLGLTRLFKFQTPFNPSRLRNIGADFDLKGNLQRLNVSARLAASGLAMTGGGDIEDVFVRPRVNLNLGMKHPSFAQLSKIFALGIVPLRGADAPVEIAAKLKGGLSLLATDLKLKLAGGETSLLGEISGLAESATYNLSFSTRHHDVVRLLQGLGVPAKRLAKAKQILLLAKLTGDLKKFQVANLHGSVGETVLTGSMIGILKKPRPMLQANLKADRILLDPYLTKDSEYSPTGGSAKSVGKNKSTAPQWSKDFIDLGVMRLLDAEVTLAAERIQWRSLLIKKNRANFKLDNGLALFRVNAASAHGGTVSANGTLTAPSKANKQITAKVNFSASKVRLRQVLRAFGGIDRFSGIAGIKGTLATQGNSQWTMIRTLNGKINFRADNGVIEGVDLKRATEILANPVNVFAILRGLTGAFSEGRTKFVNMSGDYKVTRGMARTSNIKADFEFADATAAGYVDLPRWLTDMTAKVQFKGLVRPLPLPIVIKGPLNDPKVSASEDAVGAFLGNTVIGVGTAPITIIKETGKALGGALDKLFGGQDVKQKKKE